ncbi:MAG: ABC transporter permease subunit, partial [Oscillospiraceae bacterium]
MLTVINFIQRAVLQGTPLLYGATGEILTEKSGNLNLGIPGIMYIGAISGVVGGFMYQTSTDDSAYNSGFNSVFVLPFGSLLVSLLCCFLTVTLRANQMLRVLITTSAWAAVISSAARLLRSLSDVPYLALVDIARAFKTTLPFAESMGDIGKLFFSYGFMVYLAIIIAIISAVFLKRTKHGLNLRAVGENPATADAAGINVTRYKYFATCIGGM